MVFGILSAAPAAAPRAAAPTARQIRREISATFLRPCGYRCGDFAAAARGAPGGAQGRGAGMLFNPSNRKILKKGLTLSLNCDMIEKSKTLTNK